MDRMDFLPIQQQILDLKPLQKGTSFQKISTDPKKSDSPAEKLSELQEGAKAFESYFIQSLLKEMRKTASSDGKEENGLGKSIYTSLFDQAISEKISESGGIGLSKLLTEKLSQSLKFSKQATDKIKE